MKKKKSLSINTSMKTSFLTPFEKIDMLIINKLKKDNPGEKITKEIFEKEFDKAMEMGELDFVSEYY